MLRGCRLLIFVCLFGLCARAEETPWVASGAGGVLQYRIDRAGHRVPDFSYAGYRGSGQSLPTVPNRVVVEPTGADDSERIQKAIDYVSSLPLSDEGHRGAVSLGRGVFELSSTLSISASGVVLRGQGAGESGTTIKSVSRSRNPVIAVGSSASGSSVLKLGNEVFKVVDALVPVGKRVIELDRALGISVGSRIQIVHPSTKAWIDGLGVQSLGWREGSRDIRWWRTVVEVVEQRIKLDAPLTLPLSREYPATIQLIDEDWGLREIGIEDLRLVSQYDTENSKDEEHAWRGVYLQGVEDAWVSRVRFEHFVGGAVMLDDQTHRVTVHDCASFAPVSELGGYRRHTFFTLGQQCLFLRCWSEHGRHNFSVGHCAAGPNAFVNCYAKNVLGDSGPVESCAAGVLYDNVRIEGNSLNLMNRWNRPWKSGWSAFNSLLWQCQADSIRCDAPPFGHNWAIGIWATPLGDGHFAELSDFVKPISLFRQQWAERLGDSSDGFLEPFLLNPVGATSPTVAQARDFTDHSRKAAPELLDVIKARWQMRRDIAKSVPRIEELSSFVKRQEKKVGDESIVIENGWLTVGGQVVTGKHYSPLWWRGYLQRERALTMGPAITRFAPGRRGEGLTDSLDDVASQFARDNVVGYDHHYGLWYDRRRDDHLMVRRRDGDVYPPFYEQPFARSGVGRAWDGLSRYDLGRWNTWYWDRLRQFGELGEQRGFVLFHHHYFQHNILEAGAHWADSPWRPVNNINETPFPEPPPYVGDKRIFLAEQFYDMSDARYRALHRAYIRKCLENSVGQQNTFHLTSGEFTGPLSFVRFWLDTIAEWETETGHDAIVGLSCPKNVQDAILADPSRVWLVDFIDIRYWTYTRNDELYAPRGGEQLAPRQHLRQVKTEGTSFASIVRSLREYRIAYPELPVIYNADQFCRATRDGWAILFGGGSLAEIPRPSRELARSLPRFSPNEVLSNHKDQWCLSEEDREFLFYVDREGASTLDLPIGRDWEVSLIDSETGRVTHFEDLAGSTISLDPGVRIVWVREIK